MGEWKEGSAGRIGNTAELPDAPVGHFGPIPEGRDGFGRPVRRAAWPMAPHRPARLSCRIDKIRQRRGHAVTVNRP